MRKAKGKKSGLGTIHFPKSVNMGCICIEAKWTACNIVQYNYNGESALTKAEMNVTESQLI